MREFQFAESRVTLVLRRPLVISADTPEDAEMYLAEHVRMYGEVENIETETD